MPRRFPKRGQVLRSVLHIGARNGQCQEEFHDLIVREPLKAGLQEPLAQTLPMTEVVGIAAPHGGTRSCAPWDPHTFVTSLRSWETSDHHGSLSV